jgi:uncharacterized protein (TIGR03118 family)
MKAALRNALHSATGLVFTMLLLLLAGCGGGDDGGYGNTPPPPPPPAPSALSYTSPATATVGTAITPLMPTVTGTVSSYTVAPALPAGLAINGTSGAISGTPTAVAAQATYTVTATNASGSTTFALVLRVDPPPPSAYTMSPLVSDGSATAASTDPHLKNPWGLAALPNGPMWVSNNGDHTSTVYDGTGLVQTLVVNIPAGTNGMGDVTGIVASSSTTDFAVSKGGPGAAARFLFATESGTISGWAPTVDATNAVIAYDDAAGGAVYTGLALASNGTAAFLYAADFRNRKIDVFNSSFAKVTVSGGFTDPTLPADLSPFNIQAVQIGGNTVLVVAYARQSSTAPGEEVPGAGEGIVNTFDLNGTLLTHLIARGGQLNAPWGVAVAPANFGTLSNALLIGNFGDGRINGFNATTGAFLHALSDAGNQPIAVSGLWGITFGNGGRNQPTNVLYLAAGTNGEANGLYARVDLGATAPDIVAPTGVAVTAPAAAATVSGTVDVTANATDTVGVARVVFAVRVGTTTTEIGTDTSAPFSASWNTGSTANGAATLTATAFDAFGNSTASPGIAVTVNNVADTTAPTVGITAPTGGDVTGTVAVSANATDNVGVSQVEFFAGTTSLGVDTTAPYSVQWSTAAFTGAQQLTAVARDGAGNTTTSAAVAVTVTVPTPAPTLAQLQSSIFGPRCSGCHAGGGGSLPASMNLSSASASFAALVNVNSTEVPALKRVMPGDPANSYLMHKLEGSQSVGSRMPLGGPFLDAAAIDQVRAWIQAGAAQ